MFRASGRLALCAVMVAVVGCGRLGVIYDKTGDANSTTATIDLTITDSDTNDVLATVTLNANDPSEIYAVDAISTDISQLCRTRNLQVDGTYNDNATAGNTPTTLGPLNFSLSVLQTKYVVIDNSTGTPTMTLEQRNTTGVKLAHVPVLLD